MKLSKAGYGDIITIKSLDTETFLNLIHYENYIIEYDNAVRVMNQK